MNTIEAFPLRFAVALYLEVVGKPPDWETPRDLATLDTLLYVQRVKEGHGQAHGNSRALQAIRRCPVCGSTNLSRPVYRDAAYVQWVNGTPPLVSTALGHISPLLPSKAKTAGGAPVTAALFGIGKKTRNYMASMLVTFSSLVGVELDRNELAYIKL